MAFGKLQRVATAAAVVHLVTSNCATEPIGNKSRENKHLRFPEQFVFTEHRSQSTVHLLQFVHSSPFSSDAQFCSHLDEPSRKSRPPAIRKSDRSSATSTEHKQDLQPTRELESPDKMQPSFWTQFKEGTSPVFRIKSPRLVPSILMCLSKMRSMLSVVHAYIHNCLFMCFILL